MIKRFSKGFTLAEVLITVSIVGVISALTLPSLSLNVQKQQIGTGLSKAISSLEAANRLALQDRQVRHLTHIIPSLTTPNHDHYFGVILGNYLRRTVSDRPNYTEYSTSTALNLGQTSRTYLTNDGLLFFCQYPQALVQNAQGIFYVYVDTNGTKGPNKAGRDLLMLTVHTDGRVLATGSREYNARNDVEDFGTCPESWQACAGRIADNNFEVDYY